MLDSLDSVRDLVSRSRPENVSSGYPMEMRRQVGTWLHAQNKEGLRWSQLGEQIGVSSTTARNWALLAVPLTDEPATFLPVQLESEPEPNSSMTTAPVLWTPGGYRVEGLENTQLLQLLRDLG